LILALEQVYKSNSDKISVSVQTPILGDEHTEALLSVSDMKTNLILSQTFNFIDVLGGKQAVTFESKLN